MRILTTAGGNLFRIAAEQLGDATQGLRIAQFNNLTDPMLTGLVTLEIPTRTRQRGAALPCNSYRTPVRHRACRGRSAPGVMDVDILANAHLLPTASASALRWRRPTSPRCSSRALCWTSSSRSAATRSSLLQGEADSVSIDPINNTAEIDGRDLTARLLDARTQETFANQTASEIANTLAARHGLTPDRHVDHHACRALLRHRA